MAFSPPTFNLMCGIYTITPPSNKALRLQSPCNLAMGRRIDWIIDTAGPDVGVEGMSPALLLPARTDIRDLSTGHAADIVEVPDGSGRWYQVRCVDDVGRGFSNEYRLATISKIWNSTVWSAYNIPNWPIPIS